MSEDQLSMEQIDVLLSAAVAAPSMHNTQPWRFEVDGNVIDVYLDGSRALPAEDPAGRAMRIAAGAATYNLRCAAASMGYNSWFGLVPDPAEPDLVARIVIEPTDNPARILQDLYAQIPRRHTSREPVRPVQLTTDTRLALTRAAMDEGAELTWLPPGKIHEVLDLLIDTDLREIGDWHRRDERSHWIGGDRADDGIPSSVLGPRATTYPSPVRDMATRPADRVRPTATFETEPALAILSTTGDTRTDQLTAGLALQRTLLVATREGLKAAFLNQPLEFDDLRRTVQRITGKPGYAHMVIRLGHSTVHGNTPRRPVSTFIHTGAGQSS
ncbi:Acg family FMN-binding oxidoreductase [Kribbella monticola]|uniref:Acg family FMN-binding oxidoreductase n=1 Tax=Kribbella monticola TaxID=2185285 RepID=UPI000DD2DA36|nr:nitroreductase [Kribbella monticola]